jgi:hypothetical protein
MFTHIFAASICYNGQPLLFPSSASTAARSGMLGIAPFERTHKEAHSAGRRREGMLGG